MNATAAAPPREFDAITEQLNVRRRYHENAIEEIDIALRVLNDVTSSPAPTTMSTSKVLAIVDTREPARLNGFSGGPVTQRDQLPPGPPARTRGRKKREATANERTSEQLAVLDIIRRRGRFLYRMQIESDAQTHSEAPIGESLAAAIQALYASGELARIKYNNAVHYQCYGLITWVRVADDGKRSIDFDQYGPTGKVIDRDTAEISLVRK